MPKGYNEVKEYKEFKAVKPGGHECKIMKVEEGKSKAGNDMLLVYIDIAGGEFNNYYTNHWNDQEQGNKRWGCIVYIIVLDQDGITSRKLKAFITAVEASNANFKVVWGADFCKSLKDKKIGGVFGREQYLNKKGEPKFATKCVQFRSIESIKNGVEIPEDKLSNSTVANNASVGYTPVDPDDDLPF